MGRDYSGLPVGLQDGMRRYVEDGIQGGHFLTACLENDLTEAVNRADSTNIHRLQDIVRFMYNELPQGCWGSKEKVRAWRGDGVLATIGVPPRTIGEINQNIKRGLDGIYGS